MTQFKGFKTKKEAETFQKKNGGELCGVGMKPKELQKYHEQCCAGSGMSIKRYPYSVQWNESEATK